MRDYSMKMLIVAMMVLSMVSTTQAEFTFSPNPVYLIVGETKEVYLFSDTAEPYERFLGSMEAVDGGGATAFTVVPTANAGPDAYAIADPYGYAGYYQIGAQDLNPDDEDTINPGVQFVLNVTDADLFGDSYEIHLFDEDWATILDTLVVVQAAGFECLGPLSAHHPPTHITSPGFGYYSEYLSVGSPECWCYRSQCHGDADGVEQGNSKTGYYKVGANDLNLLLSGWKVKEPPDGLGIGSVPAAICADFDHQAHGGSKTGYYRIGPPDLAILLANWKVMEPPDGPGIPADCNYSVVRFEPGGPIDVIEGESVDIEIVCEKSIRYCNLGLDYNDAIITTPIAVLPCAGVEICDYDDTFYCLSTTPCSQEDVLPGTHFMFTLNTSVGDAGKAYNLYLEEDWIGRLDSLTVNVVSN
ncbi:MAG: hypothetical protein JW860_16270 [Sedimentisphaerales bacterium]|nr:hypothetical protein [Sedimentisphaerales bacterium]